MVGQAGAGEGGDQDTGGGMAGSSGQDARWLQGKDGCSGEAGGGERRERERGHGGRGGEVW